MYDMYDGDDGGLCRCCTRSSMTHCSSGRHHSRHHHRHHHHHHRHQHLVHMGQVIIITWATMRPCVYWVRSRPSCVARHVQTHLHSVWRAYVHSSSLRLLTPSISHRCTLDGWHGSNHIHIKHTAHAYQHTTPLAHADRTNIRNKSE